MFWFNVADLSGLLSIILHPGDPTMDEYHRSADKTKPNGKDKKTMSEKSKSKSSDATFQT